MTFDAWVQEVLDSGKMGSRGEVAEFLGISASYLSLILSRTRRPGYDTMRAIEIKTGGLVPISSWALRDSKVA